MQIMKQRKSDRSVPEEPKQQPDPIQSDHEQFLQAFESKDRVWPLKGCLHLAFRR